MNGAVPPIGLNGAEPIGAGPLGAGPLGAGPLGCADVVNEYCPAVTAAEVALPAPSSNVPASMSKKYVVEKLRLLAGLIL